MFKNYIKTAFRNIIREKTFSIINIVGMAIGLACAIIIFIWVSNELSYDNFHKNKDELHRLLKKHVRNDRDIYSPSHPIPLAQKIKDEIPDVRYVSRYSRAYAACFITYQKQKYKGIKVVSVDTDFFKMFGIKVISRSSPNFFNDLYSIVITQSLSYKLFGKEDPIGKMVAIEGASYTVSGLIEDLPPNTHFEIDAIRHIDIRIKQFERFWKNKEWTSSLYSTYIQVYKNTSIENVNRKISDIVNSNQNRREYTYFSLLIADIHLFNDFDDHLSNHGSWKNIYILSSIALLILIIACLNYINLTTAKFNKRSKEVALRKLVGASRRTLVSQFIIESSVKLFISLIISLILIELSRPFISSSFGFNFQIKYVEPYFVFGVIAIVFVACLLSSVYPSLFLSSFNIIQTLKGISFRFLKFKKSVKIREVFVVFQFFISISLIAIVLTMFSQYNYINTKDLGYDEDNLLFFNKSTTIVEDSENVRALIKSNNDVINVSWCNPPTYTSYSSEVSWEGIPDDQGIEMEAYSADSCFIKTLNAKILEGNGFDNENVNQEMSVIINETAKKTMMIELPVGKTFSYKAASGKIKKCIIIGVVKDFHIGSMYDKIPALFLINDFPYQHTIAVRYRPDCNVSSLLNQLNKIWETYNPPDVPFEPFFLKDQNTANYSKGHGLYDILKLFTLIPIILSLLGIFGLTQFSIESSLKNIGIRKVHGASSVLILRLLLFDIIRWIGIALVLSIPVVYFIISMWLNTFVYHISYPWWFVFVGSLLVCFLTLLIIGYMVVKASRMKPIESLRYE